MEIYATDLLAFEDDSRLAGLAGSTIERFLDCLRRYTERCEEQGLQTTTVRVHRLAGSVIVQ